MNYANDVSLSSALRGALIGAILASVTGCEGTHREFVSATGPAGSDDETAAEIAPDKEGGSTERTTGSPGASSGESSVVSALQPANGAAGADSSQETRALTCVEGSTASCGPPREEGICKPGTRKCTGGVWGECLGSVSAGSRNCSSAADNDCDGQPDDTIDDVCRCRVESVQACEEHDGLDGRGQCRFGQQVCTLGGGNVTSGWGPCAGSVGPSSADSCSVAGDDANCDGTPNGGCSCVEGAMLPCGPDTENGICQRGLSTCRNGAFSACEGAVFPARRDCSSPLDNDCDGQPDNMLDSVCMCVSGTIKLCDAHPGQDGVGRCRAGQRQCAPGANNASSAFASCTGSVGPAPQDSCARLGDDADCDGSENVGCACITGDGNGACAGDPNASRCNGQGQCVPCQTDGDCSLVSGGRNLCRDARCVLSITPAQLVGTTTVDPPRAPLAGEQLIIYVDDSISGAVLTVTFTAAATNAAAIVREINLITSGRVIASSTAGHIVLTTVEAGAGVFLSVYMTPSASILGLQGLGTAEGSSAVPS